MKRAGAFWVGVVAAFAVTDIWADRNEVEGDTFSECTRTAFRTETSATGKVAFAAVWSAFYAWFLWHINNPKGRR